MPTVLIQTVHPLSAKGTTLEVGGRSYHFTPNRLGDYVAEVVDVDVDTILSISAGYKLYGKDERPLPGGDIVEPPIPREPAARAIPAPPTPRGQHAPLGRMKRGEAAATAE